MHHDQKSTDNNIENNHPTLAALQTLCLKRTDNIFNHYLKETLVQAPRLQEAIAYAIFNGGKRFRPLLVYMTGYIFGAPWESLDIPAAAIELIHSYSLIHDDLPAMDNANLRRGKPTCHIAYGEALAILAGDTMQALAFEIIANHPASQLTAAQRNKMVTILAQASGFQGMAAGQALDILGVTSLTDISAMYQLKTGALLTASIELGIITANLQDEFSKAEIRNFAQTLGLAYQLQDDLLDIAGDTAVTGKTKNNDYHNGKITYASLKGEHYTKNKINELFDSATQSAHALGQQAKILIDLIQLINQRKF